MKWDFKDHPNLICSNHQHTGGDGYKCNGHDYGDYLIPTYHGDKNRDNKFYVYEDPKRIENPAWDFSYLPCTNPVFMDHYDGLDEYRCLGHHLTYHGDPSRGN